MHVQNIDINVRRSPGVYISTIKVLLIKTVCQKKHA